MITFLHTSPLHIERFETLVKKYNSKILIQHFVNEELLKNAQSNGELDLILFEKEIFKIKKKSTGLIICTCSTYGDACNIFENVYRIDQPIVGYLVSKYSTIGLAYTVSRTLEVSKKLINQTAYLQNKKIKIIELDCTKSWQYFELGRMEMYQKNIASQIKEYKVKGGVLFLAQASMEEAKDLLKDLDVEIYSSPEFGVKTFLEKIKLSN